MPLAIYVLLGLCIALSVYPVLDELLEQREESRLKPRLQKHRHPATPADAGAPPASGKAKGMTPEKQQEPPQRRSWWRAFLRIQQEN
jgi:hypothetical protein